MPLMPQIGENEAFEQLYELLRTIAAGGLADRSEAVRYSTCRGVLLSSDQASLLPGFVHQCLSVARFRDFITLYDPDPAVRERLIQGAFDLARDRIDIGGSFDSPAAAGSKSEWNF